MSACGVLCSKCPAYLAGTRGRDYQKKVAAAWRRIYKLNVRADRITCGGCLGSDADLFHTSRKCKARRCCLANGFPSCGDCPKTSCADLEHAQSVWDSVPGLARTVSASDFRIYAKPYCGHRERVASRRRERRP